MVKKHAPPRSAPTLSDVAQEAGVSTATVSRCLNSPERVVESTRQRVMAAVERLEYTPNFAARAMVAKRSYTIGAIIPTMENAIFARGLQAFQDALSDQGYTLLVSSSAYRPELEAAQIRTLVARGADGLLLIGHDRDEGIYDYLAQHRVPALVAWSYAPDARSPSVGFDNRSAMAELAQHVLDLGHRRIAMISGFAAGNDRARSRVLGARDAFIANGLDPEALRVVETSYDFEKGARAFEEIVTQQPDVTAVICGNDVLAAGALQEARRLGIAIPEQISVTGFDDIELAAVVSPALTTVHVPHREMGRQAAHALIAMVAAASQQAALPDVSQCISTKVVSRASLSPPPG
ncbi:LacI family DNA-binding transcriptional regulator [Pseudophaeobacter sp.]|uniref:LacI family DNA-binding transcriptional regulator n=1 Tax=Pseudophaeobacter sp. TaxID=1971739 RepID=UPI003296F04A